MKFSSIVLAALPLTLAMSFAQSASAEVTLYSNGPVDGADSFTQIDDNVATSDSFTLAGTSTLDTVSFGAWVSSGNTLNTVQWEIGTTPFSSNIDSGTATITAGTAIPGDGQGQYTIADDSFSLGDISVDGGDYYLTLFNASVGGSGTGIVGWDANNGPSDGQVEFPGSFILDQSTLNPPDTGSESFQILGNSGAAPTPEPAGYIPVLLGAALLGGFMARRKITA